MPITANKGITQDQVELTGLTNGNGGFVRMPAWAREAVVEYLPTAAGAATLKYTLNPATPTDFTGFLTSEKGAVTAQTIHGLRVTNWVGLEPASGTWTLRVRFIR